MKPTSPVIATLAFASGLASPSLSASDSGPYVRLENGVNSITGAKMKLGSATVSPLSNTALGYDAGKFMKVKFKESYLYGGAVGYRFNDSFSAEIELDHARNKVETLGVYHVFRLAVPYSLDQPSLTLRQTNFLINGIYNHKIIDDYVKLNVGAGVGVQFTSTNLKDSSDLDGYGARLTTGMGGQGYTLSGKRKSDAAFLAQLKAGVSFAFTQNFKFDAGYKLRIVNSSDVYEASLSGTTINGSEKFSIDARLNHVFSAGFSYAF